MREMRIAECGLRNCQKSLNQAEHRRQWPRASCNSAIRIPHFPTCSVWSQAFWQFRISQSAFRVSPTSLLADRNFEPGAVGFQSAPMSGFIKSQIR